MTNILRFKPRVVSTEIPLIDGPLISAADRRKHVAVLMASTLVESGENIQTDRDAVRVLLAKGGYAAVDVALCAGEARMIAYQEIVGREMSRP
jgi:hypothetical protein